MSSERSISKNSVNEVKDLAQQTKESTSSDSSSSPTFFESSDATIIGSPITSQQQVATEKADLPESPVVYFPAFNFNASTPLIPRVKNPARRPGRKSKADSLRTYALTESLPSLTEFLNKRKRPTIECDTEVESSEVSPSRHTKKLNRSLSAPDTSVIFSLSMSNMEDGTTENAASLAPAHAPAVIPPEELKNLLEKGSDREVLTVMICKVNELCIAGNVSSENLGKAIAENNRLMMQQLQSLRTTVEINDNRTSQQLKQLAEKVDTLEANFKNNSPQAISAVVEARFKAIEESQGCTRQAELSAEVFNMKKQLELQERARRRNNIVIKGLKSNSRSANDVVSDFLASQFQLNDALEEVREVGIREKFFVVKLRRNEFRSKVMREKSKLSKLTDVKIYIDPDFTPLEQKIYSSIKAFSYEMKKKGHKTSIGYSKLQIDGVEWGWSYTENRLISSKAPQQQPLTLLATQSNTNARNTQTSQDQKNEALSQLNSGT